MSRPGIPVLQGREDVNHRLPAPRPAPGPDSRALTYHDGEGLST